VLGHFEFEVLHALIRHPEDDYGAALARLLACSQSAVTTALARMEVRRLVRSSWSTSAAAVGGRKRRNFRVTTLGDEAMATTRAFYQKE
jgi:DNA-binding MarR family transcriptional regulator